MVQRYISNPYLMAGKKFDLRIYCLVTSFTPLTAYLYRSGFARFTNYRYSNAAADIGNSFIHLTNVAIQKVGAAVAAAVGGAVGGCCSERLFSPLWPSRRLAALQM